MKRKAVSVCEILRRVLQFARSEKPPSPFFPLSGEIGPAAMFFQARLRAFASLYAAHGAYAHLFQRRVIQLASIVLFHLPSESDDIRPVNKNVQLLMD